MTRVDAGRGQLGERVLDERLPVAHADRDRDVRAEPRAQRRRLRQRDVGQRRAAADRLVVVRASRRRARRTAAARRAPAADTPASRRATTGVPWAISRTPVCACAFRCKCSMLESRQCISDVANSDSRLDSALTDSFMSASSDARIARAPGRVRRGVDRQDAVAEIEDVAGPAAGARQHVVGRGEDRDRAGRAAASDRGCPGSRGRSRCAPTPRRAECASRRR